MNFVTKGLAALAVAAIALPATVMPAYAEGERFVLVSHSPDSDSWWNTIKNAIALAGEELGVTVGKDGVMVFDAAAFDGAVAADPGAVKTLLGEEGLYGAGVAKLLDGHLDSIDGTLVLRTESINKQISGLEDQLDRLDARMTKLSEMYTAQFTAMEAMIVQMQGSASSLNNLLSPSDR